MVLLLTSSVCRLRRELSAEGTVLVSWFDDRFSTLQPCVTVRARMRCGLRNQTNATLARPFQNAALKKHCN
jgi:hypothetical protein